jgi:hypothetical protein
MHKSSTIIICVLLILGSCTSGRKALKQGNYDEALYKAVKRLRNNDGHKKSFFTLKETYPLATKWHLDRIESIQASYGRFKWEQIAREYAILNRFYDEISACPGCASAVPEPRDYSMEYESAGLRAASERYDAGLASLELGKNGSRENAKQAYLHFEEANYWIKDYKDVAKKLEESLRYATITVVVKPIPMHAQALKISNEFFENKINEFLLRKPISRFVQFYTVKEARRLGIERPHQIIQLSFDDFVVGQTYLHEKETQLVKDNILLASYQIESPSADSKESPKTNICHTRPGTSSTETIAVTEPQLQEHIDHGDKIGPCSGDSPVTRPDAGTEFITKTIYGKARATVHAFTKTLESKGLLDLKIIDGYSDRVISQEKLPGAFIWEAKWGYFNGDERALEETYIHLCKNKEVAPPSPQELFIEFTQPIYQQLTTKLAAFYRNY